MTKCLFCILGAVSPPEMYSLPFDCLDAVQPTYACHDVAAGVGLDVGAVSVVAAHSMQRVEPCAVHGFGSFLQFLYSLQAHAQLVHYE